jgi:hypothetical protein
MRGYQVLALGIVLFTIDVGAVWIQEQQGHEQHGDVMSRGERVMGFSQGKTTHHFELTRDGGVIEVRGNGTNDTQTRDQVRGHFRHIVTLFSSGNFTAPMLVHARDVPGTAVMSKLRNQLHWELHDTAWGAKITVTADGKPALDAVHEFLRFQIADHKTGDCTAIR